MKQSFETDKICIEKIINYIDDIQDCFLHFDIYSYNDFGRKRLAQFAISQIITNIYETKKDMQQATLDKIPEFDKIRLAATRNIASHDYENLNFKIIYEICGKLNSEQIKGALEYEYDHLRWQNN